jgi:hypothetical protein
MLHNGKNPRLWKAIRKSRRLPKIEIAKIARSATASPRCGKVSNHLFIAARIVSIYKNAAVAQG